MPRDDGVLMPREFISSFQIGDEFSDPEGAAFLLLMGDKSLGTPDFKLPVATNMELLEPEGVAGPTEVEHPAPNLLVFLIPTAAVRRQ